ncbi:MAG: Mur ligase [Proteobacteria bacterium]|nr:Mur ligase [Pseudomonadota bacterium]
MQQAEERPAPFTDSRRLLGANPYFAQVGAALEANAATMPLDVSGDPLAAANASILSALLDGWRERVARARTVLGWDASAPLHARAHHGGATLALAAPLDGLFTATEINEWAWEATLLSLPQMAPSLPLPHAPGHPAVWDEDEAMHTLRALARSEANPTLLALAQAAREHRVALLSDDEDIVLGEGHGARVFPLDPLPDPARIRWAALHDVPVALVTGTNGKTTTVRLLAAMARAHGWSTGHSCTDGLFVDGRQLASGDYSGPAGARQVLRQPDVQCAILETARGGILRRGLAMQRAQAAVVTNLSADHYGSYGIYGLDDLARVKLTVARVLDRGGLLALNADDPTLRAHAAEADAALGWFALDDGHPVLVAHRAFGGATCGVRDGRVVLSVGGVAQDLGTVADMPLTVGGAARYNIANILGASLAATALGVPATTIAEVLARFGSTHADNPGRLQHWSLAGVDVWLDYAHNPDGLRGLLDVVGVARRPGRFGLLLGQAGDRSDEDIRELAHVAAHFHPDRVVLKDMPAFMRGRAPGEVAAILRDALQSAGIATDATEYADGEEAGVRALLDWARPGDILVLPVHAKAARAQVSGLLDRMAAMRWVPGQTAV